MTGHHIASNWLYLYVGIIRAHADPCTIATSRLLYMKYIICIWVGTWGESLGLPLHTTWLSYNIGKVLLLLGTLTQPPCFFSHGKNPLAARNLIKYPTKWLMKLIKTLNWTMLLYKFSTQLKSKWEDCGHYSIRQFSSCIKHNIINQVIISPTYAVLMFNNFNRTLGAN